MQPVSGISSAHLHSFVHVLVQSCKSVRRCMHTQTTWGHKTNPTHKKHTNFTPPPSLLRFPLSELLQFHTATKNTGVSVPRVDRPWKKGCHIWKTRGSDFRATDKQQTYSAPACPPNIAPTDVVQAWASTEEANLEPQWYTGQTVGNVRRNLWRCKRVSVFSRVNNCWHLLESFCSYYPNLMHLLNNTYRIDYALNFNPWT